jgi:hypothetical protein
MQSAQFSDRFLSHSWPFVRIPMHYRYLPEGMSPGIFSPTAMTMMESPHRSSIRYQLQLPVSLRLAHEEMRAQSENISAEGILLSSTFMIPEGSAVGVAVEIVRSRPGTFFSGRGRVVRAQQKLNGDFALAIKLDRAFELGAQGLNPSSDSEGKRPQSEPMKSRGVASDRLHLASAWHTET